ncbi:hypothetical protein [Glycomyces sp. L485]|nr:hypothetical protein [Glycomyces sp. L485]
MTDTVRSRPRSGRIRLVAELVIAALGIGGAGFGFYANEAKNGR